MSQNKSDIRLGGENALNEFKEHAFCTHLDSLNLIGSPFTFATQLCVARREWGYPCVTDDMMVDTHAFDHMREKEAAGIAEVFERLISSEGFLCLMREGAASLCDSLSMIIRTGKDLSGLTPEENKRLKHRIAQTCPEATKDVLACYIEVIGHKALLHVEALRWFDKQLKPQHKRQWPDVDLHSLTTKLGDDIAEAAEKGKKKTKALLNREEVNKFRRWLDELRRAEARLTRQDVWGQFDIHSAMEIREKAPEVQLLVNQFDWHYTRNFPVDAHGFGIALTNLLWLKYWHPLVS